MTLKRTMCALLAATMLVPTAVVGEIAASAAEVEVEESSATVSEESSAAGYGLANSIQEGTILHCFDWKYSDITAELPNIAAAGFTSVQTSPVQQPAGTGTWYWLYQPLGFYIPDSQPLGTKAELKTLCDTAEQYGIKIVVDVVANHLAGDHSSIQSDLKDSQYWHNVGGDIDYGNRWSITHGDLGMPDINSEHSYVQQVVKQYLVDLQNIGVDGYRFDAAKHIGLPSEDCGFWANVLPSGTYSYGEILDGPGGSNNESLMKEYTNYISVTDDSYGKTLLNSFAGGNATTSIGNWSERGISKNKLVYWAESHDTYSNDGEYGSNTAYNTQNQVDRAYAVVAAQDKASSLYFSRPFSTSKESIKMAVKGSTHFTSPEVAEVNKFHNAMNGTKEYYTTGSNCSVVCRGNGAVIVAGSGGNFEVTVPNGGSTTAVGTYTDQVSGNTWTVTSSTISGKIGESGIAVLYDSVPKPGVSASPSSGTSFTDSLTVTLKATNVSTASYKTSEGASGTYKDGDTIVVGAATAEGGTVTLNLTGTTTDGTTSTETYKYTKKGGLPVLDNPGFIFDNSSTNWSTVYAYVYDESGSSVVNNAVWPGSKMTDCGDGYWKYELDSKFSSSSNVMVIFNNGSGTQIPGAQQDGFTMSGTDKKMYDGSTWTTVPESIKVTLAASKSSVNVGDSVTLTANATGASGTVTYTFSDGSTQIQSSTKNTATWSPSTEGSHVITVTAKASNGSASASTSVTAIKNSTDPTVSVDKASGTSFTSETMSLKLTLANATSGTYSVDDGPVKSFTGSKTITIGEGKIGDSTVTVKTTATNGSTTKTYTYTYEKKYQKKTSSSSGSNASAAAVSEETSGAALASQYKTNPNGMGKQKTISIDGDISDWTSDMLIAQGAANDDPRVYRPNSMYELPVDLYALYGAYDDNNVYLMWEMTNVQDVVAPNDDYPISQGILWQTQELPFFIAIDTGKSDTIGKNGQLQTSGTIWNSGMTITSRFNRLISINTKGGNGPYVYSGNSTGLNPVEIYDAKTSGIKMGYGKGILSKSVTGIDGAYGENNGRVVGDVCNNSAAWVDFNTKGHNSSSIDFFYELSIPYSELGITKADVTSKGVGVMLVATFGMSGMDCLPYDVSMNDNADQPDTQSQENNSFEKSDSDNITADFARIGAKGDPDSDTDSDSDIDTDDALPLQVNFGTNKSAPQYASTALTLKGVGYGGTAPYKYQFSVDGKVVKASNTTATYTWTPSTAGQHTISCVITDSTGKTATVSKTFTAEGNDTDTDSDVVTTLKNTSTISETNVTEGTPITVKGVATGGTSPYSFAFDWKKTSDTTWNTKSAYGKATSVSLNFTKAGTYDVRSKVKDSTGTISSKKFAVTVTSATPLTNTSTISVTKATTTTAITVKGVATGGTSPYSFAFDWKKSSATTWNTKSAYGKATSVSMTFTKAGTYDVRSKVKDSTGTISSKKYTVTVTAETPLTNTSTISATNITAGTPITVKGVATGGTSPYYFGFDWKKTSDTTWNTKSAYGKATSVSLNFTKAGTYDVRSKVKDSTGTISSKKYTVTVTSATPLTNNSTVSKTSVTAGTAITVKGVAAGGTSPYTYAFEWKKSADTTWNTKATYGVGTSVSLNFTKAGTYDVRVKAKDSTGTIKSKTFTITVK